jgi:hypothetical protein
METPSITPYQLIRSGQPYVSEQQGRIQKQRDLIDRLMVDGDGSAVRAASKELSDMIKSLDRMLSRLYPVVESKRRHGSGN